MGLDKWIRHRPPEKPDGQQQWVVIARAFFKEISQNEGITVLMVSHDGLVDEYVEWTLTLKSGMLTGEGS